MRRIITTSIAVMLAVAPSVASAAASDYRFALAGPAGKSGDKSIVSVKLVHVPDGKAVSGAILIGEKADMSPIGMAAMTASVTAMPEKNGIYPFAIQNGSVWNKPDNWSLSLDAKVQGETQTVHGSVIVKLIP